jgi:tetratricopeptide (TPR) repeat protein
MKRIRAALALVAWALTLGAPGARAGDDDGTRSVFAFGAGNRGLGMGSAFVAAADDASAMAWNAAGLGAVTRGEFQVSQSADLGLGFQESFLSAVLPSWRWGTTALSLRSFGVGGIERRDERNALLADDLTDQELELAVGYGRSWRSVASVGGAFKLRRHTLAGISGSGLGVDLGAQLRPALALGFEAPWAAEWSWGLALHNLVPPSIRLVRDASTDPTTVRSGIAWRRRVGSFGEVLSELDLEAAGDVGVRPSTGVEYRPNPWIAVRGGVEPRGVTGGTSVAWHDVSIDYAFQDASMGAEHRVGLTFQFGATVEASRAEARHREDEALQRRLAEAFQKQQAEKVAVLLARARDARGRGEPDEALDALGAIRMLEPDHPALDTLETACLNDKASSLERAGELAEAAMTYELALAAMPQDPAATEGAIRCRAELERRTARTAAMRERFARALDAFAMGRLDSARAGFASVLEQNPADPDAAAMLRRTREAIGRRVAGLIDQAHRSLAGGRPAEALAILEDARALDAEAPGLERALAAQARAARSAASSSPSTAPPQPTRAADARIEQFYRQGFAAWRDRRGDDALRFWELVWSARPGYRHVNQLLVREYLTRGIDAFADGHLPEAIVQWEKALRVDPADARARGYLTRAQEQLARSRAIAESR